MRRMLCGWTCWMLFLGGAALAAGTQITTKVTAVVDGNTLEILDPVHPGQSTRMRLYGVDCPELAQPAGAEARDYVKRMCLGLTAPIELHAANKQGDAVGEVMLPSGVSLNRRLVERGLAWLAPGMESDPVMADLEQRAVAAKLGLWSEAKPTPPWEYRKLHSGQGSPAAKAAPAKSAGAAPAKSSAIQVSRSAVEKAWETNGIGMLVAAGAQPNIDASGAMVGVVITKASAVPLAGQLGLRDGDVVMSVNGVTVKGLDLMSVADQLEDKPTYRAEILRGGKIVILNYAVTK